MKRKRMSEYSFISDTSSFITQVADDCHSIVFDDELDEECVYNQMMCEFQMAKSVMEYIKNMDKDLKFDIWLSGLDDGQLGFLGMDERCKPYSLMALTMYEVVFNSPQDSFFNCVLYDFHFRNGDEYDSLLRYLIRDEDFFKRIKLHIQRITNKWI